MFHPHGPTFFELARQCLSSTERGYDLLAPKFDYTPFRTPDEILLPVRDCLASRWPNGKQFDTALDICCGTGAAMGALAPLVVSRFVGLDFSQGMLQQAQVNLAEIAPPGLDFDFVRADALNMPFQESFDLAVCFGALGHIEVGDEPAFVEQVHRALKPGGSFFFVTATAPSALSRSFWLSHAFNAAMRVRNLTKRPKFVMYYLTFLLPRAAALLEDAGFRVETLDCPFPKPFQPLKLVAATKASRGESAV